MVTLEQYIAEIQQWMSANRLKLNPDKTELIWMGIRHNVGANPNRGLPITLRSAKVNMAMEVRILGVTFTSDLLLDRHVSTVRTTCFFSNISFIDCVDH